MTWAMNVNPLGEPGVVGASVAGVDLMGFSQMVGRTLPFLSVFVSLYLVVLMAGWKKGIEVWPACMVSGGSFALVHFLSTNYIGPLLPDILSSIASIICTVIFLRFWHPKESWRFPEEIKSEGRAELMYSGGQVFRSWAPFILLSIFVAAWGIKPVQTAMNQIFLVKLPIEGLNNMVIDHVGKAKASDERDYIDPAGAPDATSQRIAEHVIRFLFDEMHARRIPEAFLPVQVGVGSAADGVLAALGKNPYIPPFRLHNLVIHDPLIDLMGDSVNLGALGGRGDLWKR